MEFNPKKLLFGKGGGTKNSEILKMSSHNPFSDFLPYIAWDPKTHVYLLQDDSVGFLWECRPVVFAGGKTIETLDGIFNAGLPENSVISFTLHADPHIDPFLDEFERVHCRDIPLVKEFNKNFREFISKGRWGFAQSNQIPFRNFRLLVSLKIPINSKEAQGEEWEDLRTHVEETLSGASLFPEKMTPEMLLDWSRRLFNDSMPSDCSTWDENVPLRKQILMAETEIKEAHDHIQIGDKVFRAITPKAYPKEVHPLKANELFGGYMGLFSDPDQIRTPFLFTINIIFVPLTKKLHGKCNFVLQQQAVGSLAPSLRHKQEEYLKATAKIEKGVPFVRIMPVMWVYGRDKKESLDSATRVRRIWEGQGFIMQLDRGILKVLFISSLPHGLYLSGGKLLDNLQRDFIVDSPAVSPILPVQGDFMGAGVPKIILLGRKGQLIPFDLWAKGTNAYNGLLLATTGSGKSFFGNFLIAGEYFSGTNIRILDIGRSYIKLAKMCGGRVLDFTPENPISLNPFTFVRGPEDLEAVIAVAVLMAFAANPQQMPDTIENNLIRDAVRWAWYQRGNDADTGLIHQFLASYPDFSGSTNDFNHEDFDEDYSSADRSVQCVTDAMIEKAHHLAYQMQEFTPWGAHGAYFKGPSQFNIREDTFVVTELLGIQGVKELYRVVVGLVMNAYLQDVYQKKDLSVRTLDVFDEAWQYLKVVSDGESGGQDAGIGNQIAPVLERLGRTARKHNAGMLTISQSIADIPSFGKAGTAIWGNSPFKLFLESPDFGRSQQTGLLDYDEFTMEYLKSVKGNRPKYSELFIDCPLGRGCARPMVDPFTYYIATSDPNEAGEIEKLVASGMSYHEAIYAMVKKYRS